MRFATASVSGEAELLISFDDETSFFLWRDYQKRFANDQTVQSGVGLGDFIERSESLLAHLRQYEIESRDLRRVKPDRYLLPFRPKQFRDFYCFEEHVRAGRKGRNLEMIPEWYEFPVFYFSNALSFMGSGENIPYPQGSSALDFELEIGCVIGRRVRNATLDEAKNAIFAYTLINDWSARDLQKKEMVLNMGPAKGKDFATSFGPILISPDALSGRRKNKGYDIEMEAFLNGKSLTKKNWSEIHYSFEEMIVQASKNTWLHPGEVLASGTMGGGCLLEHNLHKKEKQWLQPGDQIELRWLPDGPRLVNSIEAA